MNYPEKRGSWESGEYFTMIGHDFLDLVATNPDTPTDVKLLFLVMGRVNAIGHAEFSKGELTRALGTIHSDGSITPMSSTGVTKAINRLSACGLIIGGHVRCIQVSTYGIKREGKGSSITCSFCGINTDTRRIRRKSPELILGKELPAKPELPEEPQSPSTAILEPLNAPSSEPSKTLTPWDEGYVPMFKPRPIPEEFYEEQEEDEDRPKYTSLGIAEKYATPIPEEPKELGNSFFDIPRRKKSK